MTVAGYFFGPWNMAQALLEIVFELCKLYAIHSYNFASAFRRQINAINQRFVFLVSAHIAYNFSQFLRATAYML